MNRLAEKRQQLIRLSEIGDRPEGGPLEQAQAGKIPVSRHKERNLQQQGKRTLQGVIRLIVILPVIRLENHEALVALEHPLDFIHTGFQPLSLETLLFLHGVCPSVQREDEEVNDQAQQNNGQSRIRGDPVADGVDHIEQQFQRPQDQLGQHI